METGHFFMNKIFRNPLNLPTEDPSESQETSEDTLAAEMVSDEERKKRDKEEYKESLFGQLTKKEIKHLYNNYKIDFQMFDYDISEFLKYAKS